MIDKKELAPESLTVKEALEQGYTHYAEGLYEDDMRIYPLSKASDAEPEEGVMRLLCEKEPTLLTVTPDDIIGPLCETFAIDNEVADEDGDYDDILRKSVNWAQIAELINQGLAKRPVYYPTDIKLIPMSNEREGNTPTGGQTK